MDGRRVNENDEFYAYGHSQIEPDEPSSGGVERFKLKKKKVKNIPNHPARNRLHVFRKG